MSGLEFFVDLVTTGTVLGLDHTSSVAEVEAVFGPAEDAPSGMITCCGVVEFGWWGGRVTYFGVQAHRLRFLEDVGAPLVARYGVFGSWVGFEDLVAGVRARGFELEPVARWGEANAGYAEFWQPDSGMGVLYLDDPVEAGRDVAPGGVEKVLGTGAGRSAFLRFGRRYGEFDAWVEHLRSLSGSALAAWVEAHDPVGVAERVDWWAYLRVRAGALEQGWRLRRELDRHAVERGVDDEVEAAVAVVSSVVAEGSGLSVDEPVERWLAAMEGVLAEARGLCGRWPLAAAEVRRARVLRDRIHAVEVFAPLLTSAAAVEGVRVWTDLRPGLLPCR